MTMIYLFIVIVAVYLIFAPRFAAWFYRPFLFPRLAMPHHRDSPSIYGVKGAPVDFIQSNGNKLCAWYFRLAEAKETMLVSHGNLGNMKTHSYLTEGLLKAGFSVFIYDYSGYGASTGLPNLHTLSADAQAAYDYLVTVEKLVPENIVLYGESIGAAVAAHLATTREARALICQSGFASLRQIACETMPFLHLYPELLFPCRALDTSNSLANVNIPLLIMHGEKDSVIPFRHAEQLFELANEPKHLIPFEDCEHKDVVFARPEHFINTVQTFLQSASKKITIKN